MPQSHNLRTARIDPKAIPYRFLPIRDRDGKVFRVELGDAYAIVEPGDDGRLRIPYVEADGDVRMSDLFDRLVDTVGSESTTSRTLRFVSPRPTDGALADAWDKMAGDRTLADALRDYDVVEEEWPDEAPEDDDVAVCYDTEWVVDE